MIHVRKLSLKCDCIGAKIYDTKITKRKCALAKFGITKMKDDMNFESPLNWHKRTKNLKNPLGYIFIIPHNFWNQQSKYFAMTIHILKF